MLSVGDGIARVHGLSGVMAGELVEFTKSGQVGMALNLEETNVGVALFGDDTQVKEGDEVKRTETIASVPVGEDLSGRVVDALGVAIDGGPAIKTKTKRMIEVKAPGIIDRKDVHEPLQTGLKAVDALTRHRPGPARTDHRGPAEPGKTALAIDTIHQPARRRRAPASTWPSGRSSSTVAQRGGDAEGARRHGYTIVVARTRVDPAPMQYIAPYAGCAMASISGTRASTP